MHPLHKLVFSIVLWTVVVSNFTFGLTVSRVEAAEALTKFSVYFHKAEQGGSADDCSRVSPVMRKAPINRGMAREALNALFLGPSPAEQQQGYYSPFSSLSRSILKRIRIVRQTAYVDLHDIRQLLPGVSSSCSSTEFLTEVESTLRQFASIKRVVIAIEGKPRDFYEWIQAECNSRNDQCDPRPFASVYFKTKKIKK